MKIAKVEIRSYKLDTKFQFAFLFTTESLAIEFNKFLFNKYEKKSTKFYMNKKSIIWRHFFNSREKAIEIKNKNVFLIKEFIKQQKLRQSIGIKEDFNEEKLTEQCSNCNFVIYGWSQNDLNQNKKLHFTLKHQRKSSSRYKQERYRK